VNEAQRLTVAFGAEVLANHGIGGVDRRVVGLEDRFAISPAWT
jgi:hypothetical protein